MVVVPSLQTRQPEWKWNIAHYGGILLKLWSLVSKYVCSSIAYAMRCLLLLLPLPLLLLLLLLVLVLVLIVRLGGCFALAKIILMRFNDFIVLVVLIMLDANADALPGCALAPPVPVGCFI